MAETTLEHRAGSDDAGAPEGTAEPAQRWITRRRLAKWNRPAPPHDWRWAVSTLGRVLIATGILLFGFVAYQLWGTGLETARAQRSLAEEFDELLATAPARPGPAQPGATPAPATVAPDEGDDPTPGDDDAPRDDTGDTSDTDDGDSDDDAAGDGTGDTSDTGGTGDDTAAEGDTGDDIVGGGGEDGADSQPAPPPPPESEPGEPVARIEIPSIGVDEIVVAGVRSNDLQKGPGHFPRTPLPGQLGNASIAGHRTTYGAPFRRVDQLQPGDEIVVRTVQGGFAYLVTGTEIVAPQDGHVVATTDPDVATLTLVSCHPVYSAAQRIIVTAEMDLTRSIPFPATIPDDGSDDQSTDLPSEDLAAGTGERDDTNDADGDETDADTSDESDESSDVDGSGSPAGDTDADTDDTDTDDTDAGGIDAGGANGGTSAAAADLAGPAVDDELDEAFGRGWFHDRDAFGQIALWGLLLTMVSIGAHQLSRLTRRDLVGFAAGVAPFAIGAFFFFQNVNRLLPPGL